jgi:SAM-dependent methyltransferase
MDASLYARFFAVEDWYWWSVGTRGIFRDWLRGAVAGPSPALLDVGCGSGALSQELTAMGTVTAIDCSNEAIAFTRRRGLRRLCIAAAEELPFKADQFDAVVAVDIIEHTDDRRTLREIARVLKPGGAVLIHVPAFPLLWGEHDEVNHHRCRYRRRGVHDVIETSGLRVERLSYVNCLLFPVVLPVRLCKRVLRRLGPRTTPEAEIYDLPAWVNSALTRVLGIERAILRRGNLPIGVSLVCLARK